MHRYVGDEVKCVANNHTASSHLRSSSTVQSSGSPFGSDCAGNMSLPHIVQAAAAVMAPPNALLRQWMRLFGNFICG